MIIKNGLVFINGAYHRVDVEVKGDRITGISAGIDAKDYYDATGKYVFAGFIESHIHGGFGYDCGQSVEATQAISAQLPKYGVTSYFPTPLEKDDDQLTRERIRNIRLAKGAPGAQILGIFMYTEFRNRSIPYYRKARLPIMKHFTDLFDDDYSDLRMCLIAPELPGGIEFIKFLTSHGILPVIGYSEGDREIIRQAVALGARLTDHFPNGMPLMDHHFSQAIVGCFLEEDLYMQINCDCIHVDKDYIRMMIKLKGTDHLVAVSDNNAMSHYPEGEYELNGRHVILKDGAIRDPNGKLVSGAHSFDENMRTMLKNGFSREEIGLIFSENAARALNITDRGRIEVGRRSDLVIMDEDFNVEKTMIGGSWFFERQ